MIWPIPPGKVCHGGFGQLLNRYYKYSCLESLKFSWVSYFIRNRRLEKKKKIFITDTKDWFTILPCRKAGMKGHATCCTEITFNMARRRGTKGVRVYETRLSEALLRRLALLRVIEHVFTLPVLRWRLLLACCFKFYHWWLIVEQWMIEILKIVKCTIFSYIFRHWW